MSFSPERDLPQALACLKNVDTLLRCPICYDYLDIAMMAQQCSHTFCSLCIRKCLSYKSQCPVCSSATTEPDLRNNRILDDIVKSFQATRSQLSRITSPAISPRTPPSAVKKVPVRRNGTLFSHFLKKEPSHSIKEPSPPAAHEAGSLTAAVEPHAVDSNAGRPGTPAAGSLQPDPGSLPASREESSVVKVECPVCSVGISQQFINKHLDGCLRRNEKEERLRSPPGKRKPLTKVVYSLLSQQQLKRRLKDFHLSTQGSWDQLVRRHQDFVQMYNAECDSLNPKSAQDIAKEIEKNEKARVQAQTKSKCMPLVSKGQTDEEIEEVHSNYRKEHNAEFTRLIAEVKSRMKTSKRAQIEQEDKGGGADEDIFLSETLNEDVLNDAVPVATLDEESMKIEVVPGSPTALSDVSISSSVSDVFSSEPNISPENVEDVCYGKRKAVASGDEDLTQFGQSGKRARQS
ncbi:E3 ubiquitin-protein ligase RAD18-like isoform X1 [Conger conger]|uniref:E3 ubiquitin-protein ligase RAD18-like isoform X1 n=1 Tax=Conger conger TaxID=82655 RepID=UPI002A59F6B8|nr:E3 ubiquitin-protein ligase RAD18-like isoform X1 [Conger conger]